MSEVPAVDAAELTKTYGTLTAPDRISIKAAEGEVYGLLGPNGAGKTTFLRMLFGLIRPDSGTLEVFGRSWDEHGVAVLEGVAGFIESPKFHPGLSGRRNLQLLAGFDGGAASDRIDEVLDIVDLTERQRDKVGGYSFGIRQRLGVAASLVRDPRLLILDEPANGLDPAGIRDMRALVKRLASSGLTVLLSSHDMGEVEQICDDVTIMRTGTVAYHGSIAALREQAPAQAHRITTTDDAATEELVRARPQGRPHGRRSRRPRIARGHRRSDHRHPRSRHLPARTGPRQDAPGIAVLHAHRAHARRTHPRDRHPSDQRGAPMTTTTTGVPRTPTTTASAAPGRTTRRPGTGTVLRWEIAKLVAQARSRYALLVCLIAPIAIVLVFNGQQQSPSGAIYGRQIHTSGYAAPRPLHRWGCRRYGVRRSVLRGRPGGPAAGRLLACRAPHCSGCLRCRTA
ncbi:ABC transporter ATP-binding protein [Streptomyces gibsoniae]|uniref:ATP-binding cassette domain-containing protein n=1 Tax=Streptomyces gibsoniae TaxID=3075529 RepID=A0ABU2TSS8_9ACTN|nr:ATP-binding cassette domain-containing protein [Streptomyces sp. DSM 41699]MDT0463945.1 ATP-binding cassette domain-containing protein [Streptomyces sp. DSM 41699]